MAPSQFNDTLIPGKYYCILTKRKHFDRLSIIVVVQNLFPETLENLTLFEKIFQDLPTKGLEC